MNGAGLGTIVALLLAAPFAAAWDIRQMLIARRAIPIPQRNLSRATYGAFLLTFAVMLARYLRFDPPLDKAALVAGAIGAIYLAVGIRYSRGVAFDPMSAIWWGAGAAICGWLFLSGIDPLRLPPLVHALLAAGCIAGGAASVLRILLMLWPTPGAKLPNPAKIPGMPMSGPASPAAVHAALGGRRRRGFFHWLFKS
jgi:hypothetical protein